MSLAPTAPTIPTVLVADDSPTDAALLEAPDGSRVLVLRPMQTFSNAVAQITKLMPSAHPDTVRGIVRLYLPDSADFDSVESVTRRSVSSTLPMPVGDDERAHRRKRLLQKVGIHVGMWSVVSLSAIAYMVGDEPRPAPYESAEFQQFAAKGQMMCSPIDAATASCTDVDGTVMLSTVMTGPQSTLFNFTYGSHRVGMRVFETDKAALQWASADGSKALYDNLRVAGRYVFFGTDQQRVATYAGLVSKEARKSGQLPGRVTALAVGALNLPEGDDSIQLVSVSQRNAVKDVLGAKPDAPEVTHEVRVVSNVLPLPPVARERHRLLPRPDVLFHRPKPANVVKELVAELAPPSPRPSKVEVKVLERPAPATTATPQQTTADRKPKPSQTTMAPATATNTTVPTPAPAPTTATPTATPTTTATATAQVQKQGAEGLLAPVDDTVDALEEPLVPAL